MPGTEELVRLQSMGAQRVRHDLVSKQQQQQQINIEESGIVAYLFEMQMIPPLWQNVKNN